MPDLERVLDKMEIDMEDDPTEKARLLGFTQGKTRARIEIAAFAGLATVVWIVVSAIKVA